MTLSDGSVENVSEGPVSFGMFCYSPIPFYHRPRKGVKNFTPEKSLTGKRTRWPTILQHTWLALTKADAGLRGQRKKP